MFVKKKTTLEIGFGSSEGRWEVLHFKNQRSDSFLTDWNIQLDLIPPLSVQTVVEPEGAYAQTASQSSYGDH